MTNIAFIGLGAMGTPMARTLLAAGFALTGYDADLARAAALAPAGATTAGSAGEAAKRADVLLVMVQNAAQAGAALLGSEGAFEALPPDATVLLMSTIAPAEARELAAHAAARGLGFVDAPVSGGPTRAATGDLSIAISGDPAAVGRCQPVLDALGTQQYPVGDQVGQALTLKIVHQLLAGVHIAAAAEAIELGNRAGIAPEILQNFVMHGAGASWMFGDRGPRMVSGDDMPPRSALAIFVKDLGIVHDLGASVGLPLTVNDAALALFRRAADAGLAHRDDSSVIAVVRSPAEGRAHE
ncbi:MAG: NAD(P)-dependent oxidoreductase [Thermomicrobia bacterium]|nr:NAD(P)-dependent oxidoreductase [Thermomicrobia bacterium]MCA1724531.1 NAD(P)-dependent oxidoreductase [Thermomicrobia bacterium]